MAGLREGRVQRKVLWLVPEASGGIRSYSKELWPSVREASAKRGLLVEEPIFERELPMVLEKLRSSSPSLIHIQHEFGLFGKKVWPFYRFPRWLEGIRQAAPQARIVATAHTVIPESYQFRTTGRGWSSAGFWLANRVALPWLRRGWSQGTWGSLSGVLVHSRHQVECVRQSGCSRVRDIPHFVYSREARQPGPKPEWVPPGASLILIFGYLTPEKGQDVAIEAMSRLDHPAVLYIAGDVRRKEDQRYADQCRAWVESKGLGAKVRFSEGFIPERELDGLYDAADVVLAPFRETSGSGSLAQALARGMPILTSDLALNREIAERVPGSVEFFKSEDPGDCAKKLSELLPDLARRKAMGAQALEYARRYSPEKIGEAHADFYEAVLSDANSDGGTRS